MIVYNVTRKWFTEKAEAEAARKLAGLKPGATIKVTVGNREDLSALLNALCDPQPALPASASLGVRLADRIANDAVVPAAVVDRAYVAIDVEVPDYIPRFLLDAEGQKRWDERHRVTWDEQQGMLR